MQKIECENKDFIEKKVKIDERTKMIQAAQKKIVMVKNKEK